MTRVYRFSVVAAALLVIGLICVLIALFGKSLPLTPQEAAGWDIVLKAVAGSAALLTAILALPRYFAERDGANRAALAEAQKPYFIAQQAIYSELLDVTAALSNASSFTEDQVRQASANFWRLYWGKLALVVDGSVVEAVNAFENELCSPSRDDVRLRNLSMELAHACADALDFRRGRQRSI